MNSFSIKFSFTLFLFLFFLSFKIFAQSNTIECKQVDDIARNEMRAAEKKMIGRLYKTTASEQIDVVYHRCNWYIDPAVRAISGSVTTYFVIKKSANKVVFDLDNAMIVDSVKRNGTSLVFTRPTNTVDINLPIILNVNAYDSVTIYYHGTPVSTGFGSFTQASHNGSPVLWTLSEPYGARDWWPCKNTLDDKIDSIDIFISYPVGNKGISNGLRQSVSLSTDLATETTHWKHRYPMVSYLVCLAVTNYQEFNNSVRLGTIDLPMQTFCYPESFDLFKNNTQSTLDAMQFFHYAFGDYPFIKEKYGHTQFSWGGGEEHQTNSFVINPGASLCAHELAHQWFGDKITCGTWEDIWLNEGFATHLASMFMESRYPDSAIVWRKREIESITSNPSGSVKVDDTTSVNRIFSSRLSYTKGSHLLYMLRLKLGTEVFLKAIRAYQQDANLAFDFAKTKDLQQHLEQESGMKLDSFFRQWYEGQGFPSYDVQWTQIGNGTVKIKINQTTSHSSVAFFEMPVPLKFKNGQREKTVIVDFKTNGETFIKDIGFIADSVIIDPEYWLISRNNKATKVTEIEPAPTNVVVYPNPFLSSFTIGIQNFKSSSITILVYNILGQKLYELPYNLYNGREWITIPTTNWISGKYLLKILTNDGVVNTISLLKE